VFQGRVKPQKAQKRIGLDETFVSFVFQKKGKAQKAQK